MSFQSKTKKIFTTNRSTSIVLTTSGTSGVATLIGNTLNVPDYGSGSNSILVVPITIAGLQALIGAGTVEAVIYNVTDLEDGAFFIGLPNNFIEAQGTIFKYIPGYSQFIQLLATSTPATETISINDFPANNQIVFTGVFTGKIAIGELISVSLTTSGNNGLYTIDSYTDNGIETTVTIVENTLNIAVGDGNVQFNTYTSLPIVAGTKYIWGNLLWESLISGSVFSLSDPYSLNPAEFTLVPKNDTDYVYKEFDAVWDANNNVITYLKQVDSANENSSSTQLIGGFPIDIQWSSGNEINTGNNSSLNNRVGAGGSFYLNKSEVGIQSLTYTDNNIGGVLGFNIDKGGGAIRGNYIGIDAALISNTLESNGAEISGTSQLGASTIAQNTMGAEGKILNASFTGSQELRYNFIKRATIDNITDINFKDSNIEGANINLAGWVRDIQGLSMINGIGVFTFTHDFGIEPLIVGTPDYHGFIPMGARGVRIVGFCPVNLTGDALAELSIGIEIDDIFYGITNTDITTIGEFSVNALSNVTTGQRSIQLTATVGDITGGSIRIQFEFLYQ